VPSAADATSFLSFLQGRITVRSYASAVPSDDIVEGMLLSASAAPSAHNRQPWRFAVLKDSRTKAAVAIEMGRRLFDDRRRDGDSEESIQADFDRSVKRISSAPLVIVVFASVAEMDKYPDATRTLNEYLMAVQSAAMAGQNMLLFAHAAGLAACWMCAPLFCSDLVCQVLKLPSDWRAQGLLTVGHASDKGRKRERKPVHEIARFYLADGQK
jgi:coenzyme F420-0:L-glutamate ligase/coenzyme F420-1:gamma-L-glutamate ligase